MPRMRERIRERAAELEAEAQAEQARLAAKAERHDAKEGRRLRAARELGGMVPGPCHCGSVETAPYHISPLQTVAYVWRCARHCFAEAE